MARHHDGASEMRARPTFVTDRIDTLHHYYIYIIIIIVIIIVIIIIIITIGMIRTYIEEALAGELLATDCAENLVRLPTNLKIAFFCHFIHRYSTIGVFLKQMMAKIIWTMIPEASTWW